MDLSHVEGARCRSALFLGFVLCASAAHSQSAGAVAGRVLDQTGAALPGVRIDLTIGAAEYIAVTDERGTYQFDNLPAGSGELTYRLINLTVLRRSAAVVTGQVVNVDVALTLSTSADVLVTAPATFRNVASDPWAGTEFYVNAGGGYHSNDARGAAIAVDPKTSDPAEPVTPLVRANGAEFGVRTVRIRGLQSTVSVWYLGLASELLFVGDAGTTEAGRPSRRYGVEWTNYWRLQSWLTADVDLSLSRARFTDGDPAGNSIPGALDRVVSAGMTMEPQRPVFGSIRVRHFGPRPLVENGSVMSKATTLWNVEAGYRISASTRLVLEVFNPFNTQVSDIDYFHTSRLSGEPAEGIDDVHTHPALPRSARVELQVAF